MILVAKLCCALDVERRQNCQAGSVILGETGLGSRSAIKGNQPLLKK